MTGRTTEAQRTQGYSGLCVLCGSVVRKDGPRHGPGAAATLQLGVITRGIREFIARDWRAARDAKDAYWSQRIATLGPLEAFRIGEQLRSQARLRNPGWPDADERRQDIAAHVRVAALLARASSARRR